MIAFCLLCVRRLMFVIAHAQLCIVLHLPTKVRTCVRTPERDLRTCASADVHLFCWALVTDRAPLERRCW